LWWGWETDRPDKQSSPVSRQRLSEGFEGEKISGRGAWGGGELTNPIRETEGALSKKEKQEKCGVMG